jgi:molecular chaperone DnaK
VVTVPANFTEAQRSATATAGAIAGMTIVRVLNEPTAAALAYGHMRQLRKTIAVYDFGGGTFDITVLRLDDNVYEVLGTAGDTFLGGDDIDERVVDRLVAGFLAEHRIDLRQNEIAMMRLRAVAEQTKIELSRRSRAIIKVDEIAYGPGGVPLNLQHELTRDELVASSTDLIERTFPVCEESLRLAGLRTAEIDDVVLVGGTTKMPFVRDRVAGFFGKAPRTDVNPEEAVGIGAALQAAAIEHLLAKRPSVRITGQQVPVREDTGETTDADALRPPTETGTDTGEQTFEGEWSQAGTRPEGAAAPAAAPQRRSGQMGAVKPGSTTDSRFGGDRPVQRGGAVDRVEDKGNIVPPGAPLGRMTKQGVPPPLPRDTRGLPAQPPGADSALRLPAPAPLPASGTASGFGSTIPPGRTIPPPMPPPTRGTDRGVPSQPPPSMRPQPAPRGGGGGDVFEEPTRESPIQGEPTRPAGDNIERLLAQQHDPQEIPTRVGPRPDQQSVPALPPQAKTMIASASQSGFDPATRPAARAVQPAPMPPMPAAVPMSAAAAVASIDEEPSRPHLLMQSMQVLDVTPRAFGVATVAGYCEELIRRNTRVPTEIRKTFSTSHDRQQTVRIRIFQGESRRIDDNLVIGDLVLDGLEPRPRGDLNIEVTFALDASGILNVRARDSRSGREQRAQLDIIGAQTSEEVTASRERVAQLRR